MNLGELKRLYDLGFALIYLHPKSKRPIEEGWTTGPRKKWAELEASHEPDYNVGVRLGEPSHIKGRGYLACIDVDIKDPKYKKVAEAALLKVTGGKTFPEVRSGSGGGSKHLYCLTEKPFRQITVGKEKDGWEICIYSTGRQMVLPPSVHPDTGFKYVWAKPFKASDLPVCQFDSTQSAKTEHLKDDDFEIEQVDLYETRLGLSWIKAIEDGVEKGRRSDVVYAATLAMCRAGLTDDQILSVLSDEEHGISELAYERRGAGNRRGAVDWLRKYALSKARHETHPMRMFENKPKDLVPLTKKEQAIEADEIQADLNRILPDLDGQGKPKTSVRNIVHVLEHFFEGGLVGRDDFANRVVFLKDTPYGGVAGRELTDQDDLELSHYLACHYRFEPSTDLCFKAHALIAAKYAFHPVKDYLSGLTWDKTPRLDTWLMTAFGARGPMDYLRAISRKCLVAAVARVFEPGCKFDHMVVLEGFTGKGKSMSLGILASKPWFTDSLGDIHNKDVVDQMTGKWVIEVSELASIRGRENEAVKAFLSREVDRVRPPYGRRAMDFPRQSIFIGSTNNSEYLSDETGNRRYWPVAIEAANRKWIKLNRDQLWAEAVMRYELGENLYLTPELEEVAAREQEKRFEVDEWELLLKQIIKKSPGGSFTGTELWRAIHSDNMNGHPSRVDGWRIAKIMRRLKFERAVRRVDKVNVKVWVQRD